MDCGKDFGMTIKLVGVILVIFGCGGVGFQIAVNYRQEEKALRQLVDILDFIECELQYRLTPLPGLCIQVSQVFREMPGRVFLELAKEIEARNISDVGGCMNAVLNRVKGIPPITGKELEMLGKSIGRFDLEGQIKGLEAVRQDCKRNLELLSCNRENRLRSYQTLGLCAGAALAILFV